MRRSLLIIADAALSAIPSQARQPNLYPEQLCDISVSPVRLVHQSHIQGISSKEIRTSSPDTFFPHKLDRT